VTSTLPLSSGCEFGAIQRTNSASYKGVNAHVTRSAMAEIDLLWRKLSGRKICYGGNLFSYGENYSAAEISPMSSILMPLTSSCCGEIVAALLQCVTGQARGRDGLPVQFRYQNLIQRLDCGFHKVEERSSFHLRKLARDGCQDRLSAGRIMTAQEKRKQVRA
jgi:hypothetical protein